MRKRCNILILWLLAVATTAIAEDVVLPTFAFN